MVRRSFLAAVFTLFISSIGTANPSGWHRSGKIVVANRASENLSVIDARTDDLAFNVSLPPGDNPPEPMYVVNTLFPNRVWVGDRANNRVVIFDGDDFAVEGALPAGAGVFHMWADFFGRQLWVVNDIDKTMTVINARRRQVIATVPMPADLVAAGGKPHDVVLDPLGAFAYVSMVGLDPSDMIVQFRTDTLTETRRAAVGKDPHVSFNWRSWMVYSPCQNSDAVFVLGGISLSVRDVIDVPGAHGAITSLDARRFYTTNLPAGGADAIFCIDTRSNTVIDGPTSAPYAVPHNVTITPDGRKLYVTHSGATSDKVTIYRANRNSAPQLIGEVTVGDNPFGLSFVR